MYKVTSISNEPQPPSHIPFGTFFVSADGNGDKARLFLQTGDGDVPRIVCFNADGSMTHGCFIRVPVYNYQEVDVELIYNANQPFYLSANDTITKVKKRN